ncbi:hypothetical protein D3C73_1305390 [compost metagenome]
MIEQQTAENRGHYTAQIVEADRTEVRAFPFRLGDPVDQHIHHSEQQHFTNCEQDNADHHERDTAGDTEQEHTEGYTDIAENQRNNR